MASVRFENVSISYGAKQVVKDFSLSVNDGEIMGIIGPSGCGKTTLIRALCGLIKPDKGSIYIADQLVFSDEKRVNIAPERRGVGVVFQDYAVWPHLSVWDNVCYPMKKHKVPKEEIAKRAAYALEQVRMTGYEKHMPAQLSGGQQQRVAIARSLVSSDELIVLDEPITNLDAKLREEMILEIQMIQQNIGTTIIYITHDQEAALQLCDRIAIMQPDGQICQIGSDEEIIRRPASRFVYSFIGVSNFLPVTEKGGKVCLALGGEPVLFDAPPQGYVSGKKNVMGVRPMDIVFDAESPIRATIRRDTFLGNQYDYQVELMGRELRVERNALDVLADPTRYEAGQEVGLKFLNVKFYEEEAKA
ncbi:MAG: ABC transporter ATP-binding protein [Christensenellales bacterium]